MKCEQDFKDANADSLFNNYRISKTIIKILKNASSTLCHARNTYTVPPASFLDFSPPLDTRFQKLSYFQKALTILHPANLFDCFNNKELGSYKKNNKVMLQRKNNDTISIGHFFEENDNSGVFSFYK